MVKLKKLVFRLFLFAALIGLLNTIFPNTFTLFSNEVNAETTMTETTSQELIDAMDNIDIYSTYKYQTLTDERLAQLSTGFYLPANYQDVQILWSIDNPRFEISSSTISITITTISGDLSIEVYQVNVLSLPSAIQGNDPFLITATFLLENDLSTKTYSGELIPIMPVDFWGGVFFTFFRYASLFFEGVLTTLVLSLAGTVIGFFLAMVLVLMRLNRKIRHEPKMYTLFRKSMESFAKIYVTVFRGTPMIVQAAFFWYGLGLFGDAMLCGLFVVSLNTTAYIAEILRGGIQSIDSGQTEAARSLGMSSFKTMRYVIFPQAIKNSMPTIGNEFVINIKDTSVLSIIGIFELFNQTQKIAGMHYRQLEAYFVVALVYLFLTYTVTKFLQAIERKLDMPVIELTSSN